MGFSGLAQYAINDTRSIGSLAAALGRETATAVLWYTPAASQRYIRRISPFVVDQLLDAAPIAQINIRETENYTGKRLVDMANTKINTLTPDR